MSVRHAHAERATSSEPSGDIVQPDSWHGIGANGHGLWRTASPRKHRIRVRVVIGRGGIRSYWSG